MEDLARWVKRLAITNLLLPVFALMSNNIAIFVIGFSSIEVIVLVVSLAFFLLDYVVNGFVIFGARRYSSHAGLLLVFGIPFLINSLFLRFYYPISVTIFRDSEIFHSTFLSPFLFLSIGGFLFGGILLLISQDIPFSSIRTHFRIIGGVHLLLCPYWFWLYVESLRVEGLAALGVVIAAFPAAVVKVVLLPLYTAYAMNRWHQFLVRPLDQEVSDPYPKL